MINIPRKVRITSVDHDGFNGRESPPADSDIGKEVTVISILP